MRQHFIPFAVATAVLVVSMGTWVVLSRSATPTGEVPDSPVTVPSEPEKKTKKATSNETTSDTPAPAPAAEKVTDTPAAEPPAKEREPAPVRPRVPARAAQAVGFPARMAAGQEAFGAGNFARAETEFAAAVELMPEHIEARLRLAETEFRLGDHDKARDNLAAVEELDAANPARLLLLGRIALAEEKFSDADAAFGQAGPLGNYYRGLTAAFYDRSDEARQLLGVIAGSATPEAAYANGIIAAFDEYALFPDGPKSHLDTLLARAFNKAGQYALAAAKLRPVLAAEPEFRDAWLLLGYAELGRAGYASAVEAFQTASRLDPAKPETAYFLGVTHAAMRQPAEAVKYFELASANGFRPEADLVARLAATYYDAGMYDKAVAAYEQSLTDTADVTAYIRPVYLYLDKLADGRAAWRVASLAMSRHPDSAMAYNLAGWVSVANGYLPEAKAYLSKAVQLDSTLPAPYFNLGRYFEKAGDAEKAKAVYKRAYELDSGGSVGIAAAESYNRLVKR